MDDISQSQLRKYALKKVEDTVNTLDPSSAIANNFDIDIAQYKNIYVIGFGKASFKMYYGIRNKVTSKLIYAGIIIPDDEDHDESYPELEILKGTHPIVSDLSVKSSKKLLSHIGALTEEDLVIVLISGGGSSLFEIPEPGISINDMAEISTEVMENDGDIYVLNRIRSALSAVKNGKLAKYLYPASVIAFIVSDVIYDDLNIIASGPLVKSSQAFNMNSLVEKYINRQDLKNIVEKSNVSEIPDQYFLKVQNRIILRNRDFVDFLYSSLEDEKINLGSNISGDVKPVSFKIPEILRNVFDLKGKDFWFVCGGETTVNVRGNGKGGRNQELVLRMMENMHKNENFLFISIGTDGIDGKSIAAGGIVDNSTQIDNINDCLENNDSYTALSRSHGTIITGRTGNNVSDLMIGFYGRQK
ncbi:DUF4147 domain-containing protein [Ferroplasma sp.]|uniref:DUF4147 domain-containing protein n=1 Tax=Ferroplasma sp. TaxID=2591003 RepID=UPI00307D2BBD